MPFYFTPTRVAGHFHCICPSLDDVAYVFSARSKHSMSYKPTLGSSSALLHAGHRVSRSHALAGSLKTDASREDIHDVFRSWIAQKHPVNMDKVSENSHTFRLLAKEAKYVSSPYSPQTLLTSQNYFTEKKPTSNITRNQ